MALYGKSALDLFKEIAQCPADILPPYNVSLKLLLVRQPGLVDTYLKMGHMQDELVRVVQTEIQEHKAQLDTAFL